MTDRSALAEAFRRFAAREAVPGGSPLYDALCHAIADSPSLLELAAESHSLQPAPNLLLAALHLFVRREPAAGLAAYFPSTGGARPPDAALPAALEAFAARHRDGIVEVLRTRFVQTNEVRRTSCLLPAFAAVHAEANRPLVLVEAGCSAGLNLLFDSYHYEYGHGITSGDPASPVRVDTEARAGFPPAAVAIPPVARRMGVDLNPLDVSDPADLEWLHALIWPEHADRRDLLGSAAAIARRELPPLVRGDATVELERMVADVPGDEALVVFAAFVLHQIPPDGRRRLREALERLGRRRPVWFVVMGFAGFVAPDSVLDDGSTGVWLARFDARGASRRQVVRCHPHGRWMELLPGPTYTEIPPDPAVDPVR